MLLLQPCKNKTKENNNQKQQQQQHCNASEVSISQKKLKEIP